MDDFRPAYVSIHLTNRCDARCLHCRIWRNPAENELDAETLCRAVRDLAAWLGPMELKIAGGEPLLSPNLKPLVRCALEAGLDPTINTNGFSLSGELAHELAMMGLDHIVLSLDGFDHVHNKLRCRPDAFPLAERAITHATDNGMKVFVNCVICRENIEILQGFVTWVHDNPRLSGIFFQALMQPFGEEPRDNWWVDSPLFPDDSERVAHVLGELLDMKRAGFPILNEDAQFPVLIGYFRHPGTIAMGRCNVGNFGLTIEGTGVVKFCGRYEPIGNLFAGKGIVDIATGKQARRVRAEMANCRKNCHLLINCCFDESAVE